ncbi:MAG: hypothetical protein AAF292_05185 [Pseudomonadota bacterium]
MQQHLFFVPWVLFVLLASCASPNAVNIQVYPPGYAVPLGEEGLNLTANPGDSLVEITLRPEHVAELNEALTQSVSDTYESVIEVEAGDLLYPIVGSSLPAKSYCTLEIRFRNRSLFGDNLDRQACFSDENDDGYFDRAWHIWGLGDGYGFGGRFTQFYEIPPISYSSAITDQLPTKKFAVHYEGNPFGRGRLRIVPIVYRADKNSSEKMTDVAARNAAVQLPRTEDFPEEVEIGGVILGLDMLNGRTLHYRVIKGPDPSEPVLYTFEPF